MSKAREYLLKSMYLQKDEDVSGMFKRVAHMVSNGNKKNESVFFQLMNDNRFLPNSPALMAVGKGNIISSYAIYLKDSGQNIEKALAEAIIIHQSNGGIGFSFSRLRPRSDLSYDSAFVQGPASVIKIFDNIFQKEKNKRKNANMAVLRVDHPDILEFIEEAERLKSFNVSIGMTENFMKAVEKNNEYRLINPRTSQSCSRASAGKIWNAIIMSVWKYGSPGILFLEKIAAEATSPCGEVPLLDHESCPLGSLNLSRFAKKKRILWKDLSLAVQIAVRFLDSMIDANAYPLKRYERIAGKTRKIGLGIMGFSDMLAELEIAYNSKKALYIAGKLMSFISKESRKVSRNAATCIAPTGSISLIAKCSPGFDPVFAKKYSRMLLGKKFPHVTKEGRDTMLDIDPIQQVRMQSVFQRNIDYAVSKTVVLSKNSKPEDIENVFLIAHSLGCKGISAYRQCSRKDQVMNACSE